MGLMMAENIQDMKDIIKFPRTREGLKAALKWLEEVLPSEWSRGDMDDSDILFAANYCFYRRRQWKREDLIVDGPREEEARPSEGAGAQEA
jgi:hypothetical protein